MSALTPVSTVSSDETIGYNHWCPGCKSLHFIPIKQYRKEKPNPVWSFNGDLEKPTFNPSIRCFFPAHDIDGEHIPEETLCHYFIRSGNIEFCSDSPHHLAGRTVPLRRREEKEEPMTDRNQKFLDQLDGKDTAPQPVEGKIQYTSHPILNYKLGTRWQFENGLLTLENEEEEQEFLKSINSKNFPPRERARIRKLDFAAATALSRAHIARSHTTQQIDSSTGERPDNAPRVGTGDLLDPRKREELGMEAAAEGGREMNIPGAPDSNRETQTEPSPQAPPETPFRAEAQGRGGQESAKQLAEEVGATTREVDPANMSTPPNQEPPAVEQVREKPGTEQHKGFGGLPTHDQKAHAAEDKKD